MQSATAILMARWTMACATLLPTKWRERWLASVTARLMWEARGATGASTDSGTLRWKTQMAVKVGSVGVTAQY